MKIIAHGDTLTVSDIQELAAATASSFRAELGAALDDSVREIELDLSETTFVDCGGLGALVALRKMSSNGHPMATIRLLNPPKLLQQMVDVMKLGGIFLPVEMPVRAAAGVYAASMLHAAQGNETRAA